MAHRQPIDRGGQGGGHVNRVYGADANFHLRRLWFVEGWLTGMEESGTLQTSVSTRSPDHDLIENNPMGSASGYHPNQLWP